jgi:hypothetical protein
VKNIKIALGFALALFATACGGDDGGKANCAETILCAADCNTENCVDDCMAEASSSGKKQATALATCFAEADCEDEDCLLEECAREVNACEGLDEVEKPEAPLSKVNLQ